jgi:hypothetical protein
VAVDAVMRTFLAEVEPLGPAPDTESLVTALQRFASDSDYWAYQVGRADGSSLSLHRPDAGVQVLVVHRTDGTLSYVHSHSVWVALTALEGVETHRRYEVHPVDEEHADVALVEERELRGGSGEVVTLTPPHDVHSHGHLLGSGPSPYTLIVLGDNLLRHHRAEYDLVTGRRRPLPPGEAGTRDLAEPQSRGRAG